MPVTRDASSTIRYVNKSQLFSIKMPELRSLGKQTLLVDSIMPHWKKIYVNKRRICYQTQACSNNKNKITSLTSAVNESLRVNRFKYCNIFINYQIKCLVHHKKRKNLVVCNKNKLNVINYYHFLLQMWSNTSLNCWTMTRNYPPA